MLVVLIVCTWNYDIIGKKRNKRIWEYVVVFILILVSGLRNHVGSDSMVYEYTFYNDIGLLNTFFKGRDIVDLREPGWEFIMSFCKTLFGSFVAVQIIHAIILNLLLYSFFKKTTDKVFTALLISFLVIWFEFNFESLRQSLCVALFLNSLFLLKEKKFIKYVFISIIAFSIQNFSIFIFLVAPLFIFSPKKILIPSFVIIIIAGYLFIDENILNLLVLGSENLLNDSMQTKVLSYTQSDSYGFQNSNLNGWIKLIAFNIVLPISVIFLNIKKIKIEKKCQLGDEQNLLNKEWFNRMIMLYMFLGAIAAKFVILYRFQFYITPILIVSSTILLYDKKVKSLFSFSFLFFFLIFMIDSVHTLYMPSSTRSLESYDTRYFPYKSVFQDPDPVRERRWGL